MAKKRWQVYDYNTLKKQLIHMRKFYQPMQWIGLITVSLVFTSCGGSKGAEQSSQEETQNTGSKMQPLSLTSERQQELYRLESGFATSLTDVERSSAMEVYVQSYDNFLFQVNYKAVIGQQVVRFNRSLEPRSINEAFPYSWSGKGEEGYMILTYRTDTIFENPETPAGDMAFRPSGISEERAKAYFEIKYIPQGTRDTLNYGYWSNFYSDYRLHGVWNLTHDTEEQFGSLQEVPQIIFNLEDFSISGTDGCNRIMGAFNQIGYKIDFSRLAQTKRFCNEVPDLLSLLGQMRKYRIEGDDLIIELPMGREISFQRE
jgi:hypothetical protein